MLLLLAKQRETRVGVVRTGAGFEWANTANILFAAAAGGRGGGNISNEMMYLTRNKGATLTGLANNNTLAFSSTRLANTLFCHRLSLMFKYHLSDKKLNVACFPPLGVDILPACCECVSAFIIIFA